MSETSDKKYLIIINAFMQLIFCFFNIFFNIYTYTLKNDFNFIISYHLAFHLFITILTFVFYKIANKKIMSIMYKSSFFIAIICSLLSFLLNENRLYLVFIIQFFYALTAVCYYIPSEISTMSKNNKNEMKKFIGLNTFVGIFSSVASPFISGTLIDYVSYNSLIIIMSLLSIICLVLAFRLNIVDHELKLMPIKDYLKESCREKAVRFGYIGYSLSKFSLDGPIGIILPLILFLKTGTNFSVGSYSALASLIAGLILIVYSYYSKKTVLTMWICSIFNCIVSILILLSNSVLIFFIYYFTHKIVTKLLNVDITTNLFTIVNHKKLSEYKVAQRVTQTIYSKTAILLSGLLCIVLYNITDSLTGLTIFFATSSIIQLVSTYFVAKSYQVLQNKKEFRSKDSK